MTMRRRRVASAVHSALAPAGAAVGVEREAGADIGGIRS
jgi:hypothetical protein